MTVTQWHGRCKTHKTTRRAARLFFRCVDQKDGTMANEQNLEKGKTTRFKSGEEAEKNGRKGSVTEWHRLMREA